MTYEALRSVVARYDAFSSKRGASVAATFGLSEDKSGTFQDQPTPMEIDRTYKGKGGKSRMVKGIEGSLKGRKAKAKEARVRKVRVIMSLATILLPTKLAIIARVPVIQISGTDPQAAA